MSDKSKSLDAHVVNTVVNDTETTIPHNLGRTPQDAFIIHSQGNVVIFRGSTAWDSSNIYLQTAVGVGVRLLIF